MPKTVLKKDFFSAAREVVERPWEFGANAEADARVAMVTKAVVFIFKFGYEEKERQHFNKA